MCERCSRPERPCVECRHEIAESEACVDRLRVLLTIVAVGAVLIGLATSTNEARQQRITVPRPIPAESYSHPPDASFDRSDYVIRINQMSSFYDKPGEFGYAIHGDEYGFDRLSFVLTETQPNGGPPLHTHTVEEGHVVLSGSITYLIGDGRVTAEGPYIARVPAGVPHTFINSGTAPVNVVATFPSRRRDYTEVGPNPLVKRE
jgi:mannose-6-phosphate isomerase-like protein (cupin superfamily)